MRKGLFFLLALAIASGVSAAAEKTGPKVFISVDMEGIWGVVHGAQTSSDSAEYGTARKWMVEDVNAVIAGLIEAGAGEIVVNDSHGSMRNIVADGLDRRASLISGTPKPLSMMQGIDDTFAACLFVGYHARAGTTASTLDHTISGGVVRWVKINGQEMPELGINAGIAGYFKVPVVFLSGDAETCRQAKTILGGEIVAVAVKDAIGRYAARMLPLDEARLRLKEGAKEALLKKEKIPSLQLKPPYEFELEFQTSGQAEMPSLVPQVKRVGARTVAFTAGDYLEGFRLLRALINLGGV